MRETFLRSGLVLMVMISAALCACAQDSPSLVRELYANESYAVVRRPPFTYLSHERSDRTGGHLWTERVVETKAGAVRLLLEEDGKPLSPDRVAKEQARLADIAAHPDAFRRRELAVTNDELHATELLKLLPKAFLLDAPQPEGEYLRIFFKPNPAYQPQSIEERVLHGMSGSLLVEPKNVRLRAIEARLPVDMSIGFGLIATIKAGSNFSTSRFHVEGPEWKMEALKTDIEGHALFFKTIAKKEQVARSGFVRVPTEITPAEAVAMLEKR